MTMNEATKRRVILDEIEDTEYAYFTLPHSGLIADWFTRYWDLAELVADYFDHPMYIPRKSSADQVK